MPRRLQPQTRRVNRGRYHSYVVDGLPVEGVTTLLNGGVPKPALVGWAARAVAERVIQRRHILTELNDREIENLLRGVPHEERDEAANRGTQVHALAAKLAAGETVEVPEELKGRVDAYERWWEAWTPRNVLTEVVVINRQYHYAGTLDWLGELPDLGVTLIDVKTSRSGVFAETGLQCIAYGRAETILLDDGTEKPMPPVDTYAALWLTPDSYEFSVLDVGDADFRVFLYAAEIARWMKRRAGERATAPVVGDPLWAPRRPELSVMEGGA